MVSNFTQRGRVSLTRHAILGLALLLLAVAPSQSGIIINEIFPFDDVVDTACTGPVHIQGTLHLLFKSEGADKNSVHFNIQGSGENLLTGARYQFSDTYNDQCDFEIDCPFDLGELDDETIVLESVRTIKLIGQGDAPNLLLHLRFRTTFPPLTETIEQLNVKCN